MKKITVLGGGTGTYVVLSGIKKLKHNLAVIVNMMDSGGSTGKLRDQLGVLPPGDLRQSLVALSEASDIWRRLFLYRFTNGDLKGHNFGNIFLSALEKVSGGYDEVVETAAEALQTRGDVIPITFKNTHLCVEYENGTIIKGEGNIDENNFEVSRIKQAYLEPAVRANPKAVERIRESDYIIIGPGDLYTSIIPVLVAMGVKTAIQESRAKIIYNVNLMTKMGQTTNYTAMDHIVDLEKYLGKKISVALLNNGLIDRTIIKWYKENSEQLVEDDLDVRKFKGMIIRTDLIDRTPYKKSQSDELTRSVIRHDSEKLLETLQPLFI